MSGIKGRSGRKSNSELAQFRSLVDVELSVEDWRRIIRAMAEEAAKGGRSGVLAAQFLASHRFGVPTSANNDQAPLEPIRFIEIHGDHPQTREA